MNKRSVHTFLSIVQLAVLLALSLVAPGCTRDTGQQRQSGSEADELATLRVPDAQFMGFLPLYVADEQGYFLEEGISVEWLPVRDPGQAARLFYANQADFIVTTFASLFPAEVREPGTLRLVMPIYESADKPGSFILVRPDSALNTLSDLRGGTLGTYSGPSQRAYALLVLENNGLREPEDVRLVQVSSSTQVQALFGGSFDALFTVETYGSTAVAKGARVLESGVRTRYISDPFWVGSGAVSQEFARAKPETLRALQRSLARAVEFIDQHESEARSILAQKTNTPAEVAESCALYTWVPFPSDSDIAEVQQHANLLHEAELLDVRLEVKALF